MPIAVSDKGDMTARSCGSPTPPGRGQAHTFPRARHRGSSPTPPFQGRPFKARRSDKPSDGQFHSATRPDCRFRSAVYRSKLLIQRNFLCWLGIQTKMPHFDNIRVKLASLQRRNCRPFLNEPLTTRFKGSQSAANRIWPSFHSTCVVEGTTRPLR